jgi:hypothetical protein
MIEVLTKKFWRDVKKTFDDARSDTLPVTQTEPLPPAEEKIAGAASEEQPSEEQPSAPQPDRLQ